MKLIVLSLLLTSAAAFAQSEELENPGSVSAVQERLYRMEHELSLTVGLLPLDAYYKGLSAQVAYTVHFSDYFGWTVGRGLYSYNLQTGLRSQLERDYGVLPTVFDQVNYRVGSDLVWSPFYGKASYMNRKVMHAEVYFTGGASIIKMSNSGFTPAVAVGVGVRIFSGQHLSFRFDLSDDLTFKKFTHVPIIQMGIALNFGASE